MVVTLSDTVRHTNVTENLIHYIKINKIGEGTCTIISHKSATPTHGIGVYQHHRKFNSISERQSCSLECNSRIAHVSILLWK